MNARGSAFDAGASVSTALPIRNLDPSAVVSLSAVTFGETRLTIDDASALAAGQSIFIEDLDSSENEIAEIDSVGARSLDLAIPLTNDYSEGSVVLPAGAGEQAFWLRVVARPGTPLERKRLKLNVRG